MHGDLHHWAGALDGFFDWLHGAVHSDSVYLIVIIAWIETLMAIGAAYMKSMIPLRTMAMLENVFGAAASLGTGSLAGLIKHVVNFPLHDVRLREMRRLIAKVREASNTGMDIEWLKPFMHSREFKAGSKVFSKGDAASEAFLIVDGSVVVPEASAVLEPGALFGEMALFTAEGRRTASAVCTSDVRLLSITYEEFEQLYFQNPEFGFYLLRLIVRRYEMGQAEPESSPVSAVDKARK